jgi:hypothetical protein
MTKQKTTGEKMKSMAFTLALIICAGSHEAKAQRYVYSIPNQVDGNKIGFPYNQLIELAQLINNEVAFTETCGIGTVSAEVTPVIVDDLSKEILKGQAIRKDLYFISMTIDFGVATKRPKCLAWIGKFLRTVAAQGNQLLKPTDIYGADLLTLAALPKTDENTLFSCDELRVNSDAIIYKFINPKPTLRNMHFIKIYNDNPEAKPVFGLYCAYEDSTNKAILGNILIINRRLKKIGE